VWPGSVLIGEEERKEYEERSGMSEKEVEAKKN
jgi:hypothetical protein